MMNVGIQCCKRNGVSVAIKDREKIRVDPFGSKSLFLSYVVLPLTLAAYSVVCSKRLCNCRVSVRPSVCLSVPSIDSQHIRCSNVSWFAAGRVHAADIDRYLLPAPELRLRPASCSDPTDEGQRSDADLLGLMYFVFIM